MLEAKKMKVSNSTYKRVQRVEEIISDLDEDEILNDASNSTAITAESLMLSKLPKNKN